MLCNEIDKVAQFLANLCQFDLNCLVAIVGGKFLLSDLETVPASTTSFIISTKELWCNDFIVQYPVSSYSAVTSTSAGQTVGPPGRPRC